MKGTKVFYDDILKVILKLKFPLFLFYFVATHTVEISLSIKAYII